jgi:hypothetical protein
MSSWMALLQQALLAESRITANNADVGLHRRVA